MKVLVVLSAVLIVAAAAGLRTKRQDQYSVRFDSVDIDDVLHNDRLMTHYFKCLTVEGTRCSADGQELKKNLPKALKDGCSNCTAKQRQDTDKVIRHLIDNKPEMWETLEKKYDPTGEYQRNYRAGSG